MIRLGLWVLAGTLACSRAGSSGQGAVSTDQAEYRGKVVVTGSEPGTSVMVSGSEGTVQVVGRLEPELRRLSGATVLVRGLPGTGRPGRSLEVSEYEVTEIDGEVPYIGVLRRKNDRLVLEGKDTLELTGFPPALLDQTGAKAWIVGLRSENQLAVQSYGLISDSQQ